MAVDKRKRNWSAIVYPESAPDFWLDILVDLHIPCIISPLHDKDTWTQKDQSENPVHIAGELKKPHFHVAFMFQGKKDPDEVKDLFSLIGGVMVEQVNSPVAYARYLCHLDNPEKAQYSISDVRALGVDYYKMIELSFDRYSDITEMISFIKENDIYSYAEFLEWTSVHKFDWFKLLVDNSSYVIREYLKSRYWDLKESLNEMGVNVNE